MNILFHLPMKLKLHALICDEKKYSQAAAFAIISG